MYEDGREGDGESALFENENLNDLLIIPSLKMKKNYIEI